MWSLLCRNFSLWRDIGLPSTWRVPIALLEHHLLYRILWPQSCAPFGEGALPEKILNPEWLAWPSRPIQPSTFDESSDVAEVNVDEERAKALHGSNRSIRHVARLRSMP